MFDKSFVVNFLGQSAGTLVDYKKKEFVNSRTNSNFINTLNSAFDKNNLVKSDKSFQRKPNLNLGNRIDGNIGMSTKAGEPGRNNKIKSYKDVVKENDSVSSKKEVSSNNKNEKLDKVNKDKKSEKDIIEESLAGVLNISVEDLRKVLSLLNLTSEALTDEANIAELSQKISDLLGLNSDQSATLTKITDFIVREAKDFIKDVQLQEVYNGDTPNKENWIKLEGIDVQVTENFQDLSLENAAILSNRIKDVLNRLESKLENDPEKLFEDISSRMKELTVTDVNTAKGLINQDDLAVTALEEDLEPNESVSSLESFKSEEKENTLRDDNTQKTDFTDTQKAFEIGNNPQSSQLNEFGNIITNQQVRVDGSNEVLKAENVVNVPKTEIITQIVEKAKVFLTNEKSEMVIDLKPDHLGKLSLKVVTERGALVAKFIAESEQVKAAIESNMDNLKETLTRQGFSIQDFSVSVRQDSKRGFAEGHKFSSNSNRTSKGDKIASVGVSALEENHQVLNPYMINTSSINLMA